MENKLQQLTQKLYEEGLIKGRSEAESVVAKANADARALLKEAEEKAAAMIASAKTESEDLRQNTQAEIRLASKQIFSALRQQLETTVLSKCVTPAVNKTLMDSSVIKELILEAVKNWGAISGSQESGLKVVIPAGTEATVKKEFENATASLLGEGVEITLGSEVKSGFRVAPKDGGYFVSFSEADFDNLVKSYLRPRVASLLYGDE